MATGIYIVVSLEAVALDLEAFYGTAWDRRKYLHRDSWPHIPKDRIGRGK